VIFFLPQLLFFCLALVPPEQSVPSGLVAKGDHVEITESTFYEYLVTEYAGQEMASSLLEQIVRETLIEQEAEKRNLSVSDEQLEGRIQDLDLQCRVESGGQRGLSEYMNEENLDEKEFYRVLKLSIAQENMARYDFGISGNESIAVEKLNIWLKQLQVKAKVLTEGLDPQIMMVVNEEPISRTQFGKKLSQMISAQKLSTLLTEMIGIQLIAAQARKMDIELTEEDTQRELNERDARLRAEPGFERISYESYLQAAHSQSIESLVQSEKFQSELLLKKICLAIHHEAYLQDFFENNREYFNQQYGEAARLSTIFFKAVKFPNQFVSREFDDAMDELEAIKDRLQRGEVSFENMARIYSEHDSKKNGGDIGFVSIRTRGWEEVVRAARMAESGTLLGPIKTESGCHLVMVQGKRDNPNYDKIHDQVVREARQRYYQNLQKEAKITRKYAKE